MKKFYVYTHSTDDGRVFYVGKGSNQRAWDMKKRSQKHKRISERSGCKVCVLQTFEDEKHAFAYEVRMIEFFETYTLDFGDLTDVCNFTIGGEGKGNIRRPLGIVTKGTTGLKWSKETKTKMSSSAKERYRRCPMSDETKQKISLSKTGKKGHSFNKGKPWSKARRLAQELRSAE